MVKTDVAMATVTSFRADFSRVESHPGVVAGLVPATTLAEAQSEK